MAPARRLSPDEWFRVLSFLPDPRRAAAACRRLWRVLRDFEDLPGVVYLTDGAPKRRRDGDGPTAGRRPLHAVVRVSPALRNVGRTLPGILADAEAQGVVRRLTVRLEADAPSPVHVRRLGYTLRSFARNLGWPGTVEAVRFVLRLPRGQPYFWRTVLRSLPRAAGAWGKVRALELDLDGGECGTAVLRDLADALAVLGGLVSPSFDTLHLRLRDHRFGPAGLAALAAALDLPGCPGLADLALDLGGNLGLGPGTGGVLGRALSAARYSLRRLRLGLDGVRLSPGTAAGLVHGINTHRATLESLDVALRPGPCGPAWRGLAVAPRLRALATDTPGIPVPAHVQTLRTCAGAALPAGLEALDLTLGAGDPCPALAACPGLRALCLTAPDLRHPPAGGLPAGVRSLALTAVGPSTRLADLAWAALAPGVRHLRLSAEAPADDREAADVALRWTGGGGLCSLAVRLRAAGGSRLTADGFVRLLTALCGPVRGPPLAVALDVRGLAVVGTVAWWPPVPPSVHLRLTVGLGDVIARYLPPYVDVV